MVLAIFIRTRTWNDGIIICKIGYLCKSAETGRPFCIGACYRDDKKRELCRNGCSVVCHKGMENCTNYPYIHNGGMFVLLLCGVGHFIFRTINWKGSQCQRERESESECKHTQLAGDCSEWMEDVSVPKFPK